MNYKDIERMKHTEWLNYRDDLVKAHKAKGLTLAPDPDCQTCDMSDGYVCFECEDYQIRNETTFKE